jgi:hypothetical protein
MCRHTHDVTLAAAPPHLAQYCLWLREVLYAVDTQHHIIAGIKLLEQQRLQVEVLAVQQALVQCRQYSSTYSDVEFSTAHSAQQPSTSATFQATW